MPKRPKTRQCSDRLPGRESGEWARTKLQFLDDYIPPALQVTYKFKRRWWVDLFAGPGLNVNVDRNCAEFPGSPLRAIKYTAPKHADIAFTDVVLVNKDPDEHDALAKRVDRVCAAGESRVPRDRIQILNADANAALSGIMSQIHHRDYAFVFADITGTDHWPFSSVKELRRRGHESVDFYMLFPLEMALIRQLAYEDPNVERYADAITAFFDSDGWRDLRGKRNTPADTNKLKRDVTDLYLSRLRRLWKSADVQATIGISETKPLYRMLFASDHPIGSTLAKWQKSHDQPDFFG